MKWPFVSCICMTRDRRFYLRKAVEYYQRAAEFYDGQSELVVVDGSAEPNREWFRSSSYLHCPEPPHETMHETKIGHWTNVACDAAKGEIIVKWDDDDWHSPGRIKAQVKALLEHDEAIAYTTGFFWYHLQQKMACRGHGGGGGTLAFHKRVWQAVQFPPTGVEDTPFCAQNQARGVKMLNLSNDSYYVYIRHHGNTSPNTSYGFNRDDTEACRELLRATGDLEFYDELSEILPFQPWNQPNAPGSKAAVMSPLQRTWARHYR